MSTLVSTKLKLVTAVVLLGVGFLAGPVVAFGQAILGWLLLSQWGKIQARLRIASRLQPVVAAVAIIVVAALLDAIFLYGLGALVQSQM